MNAHAKYSTQFLQLGLLALAACAVAGCWEEVHYTPPPGGDAAPTRPRETPPAEVTAAEDTASNFADDVAASLNTTPPTPSPMEPAPSEPAPSEPATGEPASAGGASPPRYTETTPIPEVEPPRPTEPAPILEEVAPRYVDSTPALEAEPPAPITPAVPVAPAVPAAANPAGNTRRVAWLLGAKLSLAALANGRGGNPSDVAKWFDQSQSLAKLLGTHVDPLPAAASAGPSNAGVEFVFTQGQRIGNDLQTRYDAAHAALFELAAKSSILIALYEPRAPDSNALAEAIASAGQRAGLPAELFVPLVRSVRLGEPAVEVRAAVLRLNGALDQQLKTPSDHQP